MVDTLHPPPEVIASFPPPNYINPETRGATLLVLSIILTTIGFTVVGLRLYTRLFITKAAGIDDILIVVSLICGTVTSVLIVIGNTVYHAGYHVWDIPLKLAVGHRLNVWVTQLCFMIALSSIKISVLLFYRRLSVPFTKTFLVATWIGIIYNIAFSCGFFMTLLVFCRPLKAYWMSFDLEWPKTHQFKCGSEQIAQPLVASFSVLGDFYSALLPMTLISRLKLPKRQKRALYSLFGMAFAVVLVGIVRVGYLYKIVNVDYDFTWTLWTVWILGQIELWLALYIASAPSLKPLFKQYFEGTRPGTTSSQATRKRYFIKSDEDGRLGTVQTIYVAPRNTSAMSGESRRTGNTRILQSPDAYSKRIGTGYRQV